MNLKIKRLYEFGTFCLDSTDRVLSSNGNPIRLTPKAVETLLVLVENRGRVLTKDELMETIWPGTFVEEGGLARNISVLRKALGEAEGNGGYIETIPKRGYRFVARVSVKDIDTGPGVPARTVTNSTPFPTLGAQPLTARPARAIRSSWFLLGAAVLLVLGLAFVLKEVPSAPPVPQVVRVTQVTHYGLLESGEGAGPDGDHIYGEVRLGGTWGLVRISTNDGKPVPMATLIPSPFIRSFSPARGELLVISDPNFQLAGPLWAVPTDGSPPRRLRDQDTEDAAFSPDNSYLVYSEGASVYRANPDGSNPDKLFELRGGYARNFQWCPVEGSHLIRFTREDSATHALSIWEVSEGGSNLRPYLAGWSEAGEGWGEGPSWGRWSSDGRYFWFRTYKAGVTNLWAVRERGTWLHPAERIPVEFYSSLAVLGGFCASADGRLIYAVGENNDTGELDRFDTARHAFAPYLKGIPARWVDFSRDGKWMAYVNFSGQVPTLWRSRADGSDRLQLTYPPLSVGPPRWSPDGQSIAFRAARPGQRSDLLLVARDGGPATLLPVGHQDCGDLNWSVDGQSLFFRCADARNKLDLAYNFKTHQVGEVKELHDLDEGYALSPKGDYAAGTDKDGTRLVIVDMKTGRRVVLMKGETLFAPHWTSDARTLYVQGLLEGPEQPVYRIQLSARKVEKVATLKDFLRSDLKAYSLTGLTPDGSPLVSIFRGTADLYAIEIHFP
jgi:DNA-binding winged helix-turn-helix (wHTH) protein/Tol biopolymer transport system component